MALRAGNDLKAAAPSSRSPSRSPRPTATAKRRTSFSSTKPLRAGLDSGVEAVSDDELREAAADDGQAEPRTGGRGKADAEASEEASGKSREGGRRAGGRGAADRAAQRGRGRGRARCRITA